MSVIRSRDNLRVRRWLALMRSGRARRNAKRALIEGAHLIEACLQSGGRLETVIVSEGGQRRSELVALLRRSGTAPVVLEDRLFGALADTQTPAGIVAEIALPEAEPALADAASCVFLDGIQDAGNVGAILRSAAAFGVRDVVLGAGCADPWSPKVLRAAMGAHFGLRLATGSDLRPAFEEFGGALACTVVRGGTPLPQADLRGRLGWIFGGEGRGVSEDLRACAQLEVSIPMAGPVESLNVAAAAAVCFYERARQVSTPGARS